MPNYAVVSDQILTGTIADLPYPSRLAWTAIIFEAEKLRGRVKLPPRVLAKKASITTAEAVAAIEAFLEPDPLSSSKEHDGRRLLPIEGEEDWYEVTTWEKHAAERAAYFNRLRQQRARERARKQPSVALGSKKSPLPVSEDAQIVLRALEALAPQLRSPQHRELAGWLAHAPSGWHIAAALHEVAPALANARTLGYIGRVIADRARANWFSSLSVEDAKGYTEHRYEMGKSNGE